MTDGETLGERDVPLDLRFSEAELESRREHIVGFIEEQVEAAGVDRTVLGLSGGIDSTLTAFLAVEALGEDGLHGLVMPSQVSTDENMSDAERVAEMLDVEYDVIEIEPIVDRVVDSYPEASEDREAVGNVQVRTRAVLNYFVANYEGALVLGTGNRSEAAVGYFTKYGDGAVDCHPIGNLYKQQVRQLAYHVGVPDDLIEKTPSAEMWTGQTDEEEMGLGYDELDAILALHVDGPLSKAATTRALGVDDAAVERVVEMHRGSAHKRAVPPAPEPPA